MLMDNNINEKQVYSYSKLHYNVTVDRQLKSLYYRLPTHIVSKTNIYVSF
jgi:hypothetical protein